MPEPGTISTAIRLGLAGANLAGVDIPGISSFFGGGTSSADRQARLMASFQGTAGKKNAFDQQRISEALSAGTVLDVIQNTVTFMQRDDKFKQPHTAIITTGNPQNPFDLGNTAEELVNAFTKVDLGGGSEFGGAGVFLTAPETVVGGVESVYKNLLQFDPDKAQEFRTLAESRIGISGRQNLDIRKLDPPRFDEIFQDPSSFITQGQMPQPGDPDFVGPLQPSPGQPIQPDPGLPTQKSSFPNIPISQLLKSLQPTQFEPEQFKTPTLQGFDFDFFDNLAINNVLGGGGSNDFNFGSLGQPQQQQPQQQQFSPGLPFSPTSGNLFSSKRKPMSGLAFLS